MAALAKLKTSIPQEAEKEEEVLIHVRYQPSAEIFSIDACPEDATPRDWLNRLLENASDRYQTFAGGRGLFRIPRGRFDAILNQGAQ
ncbi:hypothetical protein MXD81_41835 [Microbacteriaceae bacterium K1510]|nr:hypothetical protein [Microbacteriaceae bacterium K1510]